MTARTIVLVMALAVAALGMGWVAVQTHSDIQAEAAPSLRLLRTIDEDVKTRDKQVCALLSGVQARLCRDDIRLQADQRRREESSLMAEREFAYWTRAAAIASLVLAPVLLLFSALLFLELISVRRPKTKQRSGAAGAILAGGLAALAFIGGGGLSVLAYTQAQGEMQGAQAQLTRALRAADADLVLTQTEACNPQAAQQAAQCNAGAALAAEQTKREEQRSFARKLTALWGTVAAVAGLALVPLAILAILLALSLGAALRRAQASPLSAPGPATVQALEASPAQQLQVRAYLQVMEAIVEFYGETLSCAIRLRNSGQSPALKVVATVTLQVPDAIGWEAGAHAVTRPFASPAMDVAALEMRDVGLAFESGAFPDTVYQSLSSRSTAFEIAGSIAWSDVFGPREAIAFVLREGQPYDYAASASIRREGQILFLPHYAS